MTTRYDVVIRGGTVAENAVRMMTPRSAAIIGLQDRGVLAPGYKANVNAIDHANLAPHGVTIAHDLPAGGRRLDQTAAGYRYRLVSCEVVTRGDAPCCPAD